ncbi:MAG: hypothetical protein KDC38_06585 [Planctomycetes bacterium]|nr:hypothetical protein [Planctomycetota bacterium]
MNDDTSPPPNSTASASDPTAESSGGLTTDVLPGLALVLVLAIGIIWWHTRRRAGRSARNA